MKKILCIITTLIMLVACMMTPNMTAYAANITLGVSASSVQIGDSVKVTVTIPENVSGPINVSLSNDVLTFSSSTAKELGVNGKYISISMGKYGLEGTNKVTLTFKAKTSGSVTITASHGDIFDNDTFDSVKLDSASTTIIVENKTTSSESESGSSETQKSADNSLSSLKLSKGTLSPKFKYSVTNYTATVENDVTQVVVSAKTSNEKATIDSVTDNGTVKLKVGENTIKIVVKAENGEKATYTIVVTRKEKATTQPSESESQSESQSQSESTTPPPVNELLQWNGEQLYAPDKIPSDSVPTDFETTSIVVNGQQMQGLSFTKGELKLLYLNNTNGAGSLYVYDEEQQTIYPFIKIVSEKSYVMVLVPNEEKDPAPAGFESCTFSIEGKGVVNAYQLKEKTEDSTTSWNLFGAETFYGAEPKNSDFYLIYCMNNNGEKGWYMYDIVEETFQRYFVATNDVQPGDDVTDEPGTSDMPTTPNSPGDVAELQQELKEAKQTQYIIIAVAAGVAVVLMIIIIVLLFKMRSQEDSFLDEYEEDDEEYNEMDENLLKEVIEPSVEQEERKVDTTSKLLSKKNDDDLEFINFK